MQSRIVELDHGIAAPIADAVESRISGSVTVQVIPYSLAALNPDGLQFCVPMPHSDSAIAALHKTHASIPVLLNGIPPWKLTYSVHDFYSGKDEDVTVDVEYNDADAGAIFHPTQPQHQFASSEAISKHKMIHIEAHSSAMFTLKSLQDLKGEGSISSSLATNVTVCPETFWSRLNSSTPLVFKKDAVIDDLRAQKDQVLDICAGGSVLLGVSVYAIPPVTVTYYLSTSKTKLDNITISSAQDGVWKTADGIKNVAGSVAMSTELQLEKSSLSGAYDFFITKVTDGLGMVTEYTQSVDADHIKLNVLEKPHAASTLKMYTFEGIADDTAPSVLSEPVKVDISIRGGTPPYIITYELISSNGTRRRIQQTVDSNSGTLTVKLIGTYSLMSVKDEKCSGTVEAKEWKLVAKIAPTVNVRLGYIESPCFGQIGFNFDLVFTGTPPFTLTYTLQANSKAEEKKTAIIKSGSGERLEVRPPNPGQYTVKFVEFRDSKYPRSIPIRHEPVTQTFHAASSLIIKHIPKQVCQIEKQDVWSTIIVTGTGPWKVTYDTLMNSHRTPHTIDVPSMKSGSEFTFPLPPLTESGRHFIDFKTIADGNGCQATVSNGLAQIDAYNSVPSAAIQANLLSDATVNENQVYLEAKEDAKIRVPLSLSGNLAPYIIRIQRSDDGVKWEQREEVLEIGTLPGFIDIKTPGHVRLVGVTDAVCRGEVSSPSVFRVNAIARPTVELVKVPEIKICQGVQSQVVVNFTGQPPFEFVYQVLHGGKVLESPVMKVGQSHHTIDLNSAEPGVYQYRATNVGDQLYSKNTLSKAIEFTQTVNKLPDVEAVHLQKSSVGFSRICVRNKLSTEHAVTLKPTGTAPWTLKYNVLLLNQDVGATAKVLKKDVELVIKTEPFLFLPDFEFEDIGLYSFVLSSISDGNGCLKNFSPHEQNTLISVSVSKEPALSILTLRRYSCPGDTMELELSGRAPWVIHYTFEKSDGNLYHSEIRVNHGAEGAAGKGWEWLKEQSTALFSVAHSASSQPDTGDATSRVILIKFTVVGKISITSVCHGESAQCCTKFSSPLTHVVHDFPSVSVNAGHHKTDVIRQGHKSSMHLTFTGEPPFGVTYVRVEPSSQYGRPPKDADSVTVQGIEGREWSVDLSQAGTFKVTAVQDAYCRYPPIPTSFT